MPTDYSNDFINKKHKKYAGAGYTYGDGLLDNVLNFMKTDTFDIIKNITPSVVETGVNIKSIVDDVKDIGKTTDNINKIDEAIKSSDKLEVLELFKKAMRGNSKSGNGFVEVKK